MDPHLETYRVSDAPAAVAALDASSAFQALNETESLYALGLSQAAWGAGKITLLQTSPESPPIFLLLRLVLDSGVDTLRGAAMGAGASELDWQRFMKYAAMFVDNSGNYRKCRSGGYPQNVHALLLHRSPNSKLRRHQVCAQPRRRGF